MAEQRARARDRARGRARSSEGGGFTQLPWQRLENPYPPYEVMSADEIEAIHQASLKVVRDIGIDFMHPKAKEILAAHGADVDPGSDRVKMDPDLVMESLATAPATFRVESRNPEKSLNFGGRSLVFASVGSAPYASDLERGRRVGSYADYKDFLKLSQTANIVHFCGGYPTEPTDLPPTTRHMDALLAYATLTDKVIPAYSLGRQRAEDAMDMVCILFGQSRDEVVESAKLISIVNTSSPLRVDGPMLEGIMEFSAHGQVICVTPFTLAGAMAPVTPAGALVLQNAEALATMAFTQMVRPGAPVIYGGFTSNVDMKSGAPAFGTPEYVKCTLAGSQLARRYGIPFRASNANAANVPDAQAAWESMMSLWSVVSGHTNFVMHAAGWMEGGLTASFEKFMMDVEMLQAMSEILRPISVADADLGIEAIKDVGAGGHFFGTAHTLERYETAFYQPFLSDWRNFESWSQAGAQTALERAHTLYKKVLADFTPPPLDPAIGEELAAFVAMRKEDPKIEI